MKSRRNRIARTGRYRQRRRCSLKGTGFAFAALLFLFVSSAVLVAAESSRLRVVTYNIHHGEGTDGRYDYERLAEVIRSLSPDVVALQEVDRKTQRSGGLDQAELLGRLTDLPHVVYGRAMYYGGGEYGLALLSRFPIEDPRTYPLPYRPHLEPRAALSGRIEPPGGVPALLVVSTHLTHQDDAVRQEQTIRLNQIFAHSDVPVVLAGDFNALTDSQAMQLLLSDRWLDASHPASRIDYVLVRRSDSWRVLHSQALRNRVASDHPPVLTVLEWTGAESRPAEAQTQ